MESYSLTIPTSFGLSFGVKCIHVSFTIFYSALIFKTIAVPSHPPPPPPSINPYINSFNYLHERLEEVSAKPFGEQ